MLVFRGVTSFQHHMTEKHLGSPSCMVDSQNRCLEKWTMKMYEPYFQWGFSNQEYITLLKFKKKTPPEKIWVCPKIIGVFPPKSSHFHRMFHYFHYKPSILGVKHPIFLETNTHMFNSVSHGLPAPAAGNQSSKLKRSRTLKSMSFMDDQKMKMKTPRQLKPPSSMLFFLAKFRSKMSTCNYRLIFVMFGVRTSL